LVGGALLLTATAVATFVSTAGSAQAEPAASTPQAPSQISSAGFDSAIEQNAQRMLAEGRRIFRFDTFGSEDFWGGKLRLHEAIVGQKLGGVGPGVSPKMALSLGLKVDADALPTDLVAAIKAGKVDMDDPASTVAS
jgi:hypothetical protein